LQTPKISVIIPIYNAEQYVGDCLDSITSQSLQDLEIICVDDCSTDKTSQIIHSKAKDDQRIQICKNDMNMGAAAARNTGLKIARGKYISFVDADDRLLPDAYRRLYTNASNFSSDAAKGNMTVQTFFGRKKSHPLNHKVSGHFDGLSDCKEIHHLYQYQTYLLRKGIFDEQAISFDESLKNFQDPVLLACYLPHCKKISLISDSVYLRTRRKGSITTARWNFENFRSLISGTRTACDALKKNGHIDIAYDMAKTPGRWQHKLRLMRVLISRSRCVQIFSLMEDFYQETKMPLWDQEETDTNIILVLTLAILGYHAQAYEILKK
jgi:glycosyltransferase involved in cell wall biosynthesis